MMNRIGDMLTMAYIRVEVWCWAKMQDLEQELIGFMILQDIKNYRKELEALGIKLPEKNKKNWRK
jgi:hypothetical protein